MLYNIKKINIGYHRSSKIQFSKRRDYKSLKYKYHLLKYNIFTKIGPCILRYFNFN